jgi:hypothetical protein
VLELSYGGWYDVDFRAMTADIGFSSSSQRLSLSVVADQHQNEPVAFN